MAIYLLHNANERWSYRQLVIWKEHICERNYRFIKDVILSLRMNNFVRFFRIVSEQKDNLFRLAVARFVGSIRLFALRTCAVAYKCRGVALPETFLEETLHMDSRALRCCLNELGLKAIDGKVCSFNVTLNSDLDICTPEWIYAAFIF